MWSDFHQSTKGWTWDDEKITDYILWFWSDTGRWCLISFPCLLIVFSENMWIWKKKFKNRKQKSTKNNRTWFSQCVFVPRKLVWRKIYEKYGGDLPPSPESA
jgi:hypothetical protein